MRYVASMCRTLKKKCFTFLSVTAIVTMVFAGLGYVKAKKDIGSEDAKQAKIDAYLEQVEKYEIAVNDSKKAMGILEQQCADFEDYVANSLYMQLDSENIYIGSVQYTVVPSEGTNVSDVLDAYNIYVTQGGLKEDAAEYEELGVKYWSDVIGTGMGGQTFSVTIMQYSRELAEASIEKIKQCLEMQANVIAKSHGEFLFQEQDTSVYTKSDIDVFNFQNARKSDLKNYQTYHSDYEIRVFNEQNTLDQYIENNKPDSLEVKKASVGKNVILFGAVGFLAGIWIALGLVLIDYIAGNRVKSEEDLGKFGLEILGVHTRKEGFVPDVEKTAVEIKGLLAGVERMLPSETFGKDGVALYDLAKSEDTEKLCAEVVSAFKEVEGSVLYVDAEESGAASLMGLLACGSAVLVASAGDTRIEKVEEALRKLSHYGIRCLGAIILK